jgi:hypothetical protein
LLLCVRARAMRRDPEGACMRVTQILFFGIAVAWVSFLVWAAYKVLPVLYEILVKLADKI